MRELKVSKKVPGGKLVRMDIQFEGVLKRVKITGDFFMYPEEALEELERALEGAPLEELEKRMQKVFDARAVTLLGVTVQDLASLIKESVL